MPRDDPSSPSDSAGGAAERDRAATTAALELGWIERGKLRLRLLARMRRVYWLRAKLRFAPGESQRLFALTALIGVSCGLAAVAFHALIAYLERVLVHGATHAAGNTWIAWTIATPTIGGLVCGLLLQYVFPTARGSGVPQVKASFARRGSQTRIGDSFGKFAVGALQIGSGSSLGREGPTVQICAGIADWFGRLARVSPKNLRRLLPVGTAAGIAAAFNAPIAAATFTIEEIIGDLDKAVLSGVIVAAAIAAVVERSVLGEHPVFDLPWHAGLESVSSLGVYALLGILAALVAVVFTESLLVLRRRFSSLRMLPDWAKPAIGGAATGLLAVVALRWMGAEGITGGGYRTLESALESQLAVRVMLALCAMKLVATVLCYASGGAGGIFAPSLFIGGMLGGAVGALDASLLHHSQSSIGSFALVGMGAVFAAAIRAPITSVLIIIEMTGGYSLILPLMIANMIAYGVAHRIRPVPIYDALLEQDGVHLGSAAAIHTLESIQVEKALGACEPPLTVEVSTPAGDLVRIAAGQEVYPVVERGTGRLIGVVTDEDLHVLTIEKSLWHFLNVSDVMRPPISVMRHDDLSTALDTMLAHGIRRVPVVDEQMRVTGLVDEDAIARAYLRGHLA